MSMPYTPLYVITTHLKRIKALGPRWDFRCFYDRDRIIALVSTFTSFSTVVFCQAYFRCRPLQYFFCAPPAFIAPCKCNCFAFCVFKERFAGHLIVGFVLLFRSLDALRSNIACDVQGPAWRWLQVPPLLHVSRRHRHVGHVGADIFLPLKCPLLWLFLSV